MKKNSAANGLLERFEQRAEQSVIANYNGDEMIFVYKDLFTAKNEAKGSPGGSSENRQSGGYFENLKRSPFANNMPK